MIPFYLNRHITDITEKKNKTTATLTSSSGNRVLEIYYYGALLPARKTAYVTDGAFPCLIVAKDPVSGETFPVFDGTKHGYDAMFASEPQVCAERPLQPYPFPPEEIEITFGYNIDYEDEKADYLFQNGAVKLNNGEFLDWEQAKSAGFDWLTMKFKKSKREFVSLELA